MTRKTHILRPNKAGYAPTCRVYVDTEAHRRVLENGDEEQTLWFGWGLYERERTSHGREHLTTEWKRFEESAHFWAWLDTIIYDGCTLYIYAHNWDYDAAMLSLESESRSHDWTCTRYARATHTIMWRFTRGKQRLVFVDTINYFPMSLDTLGKSMQSSKLSMPDAGASQADWDAYCRRDVEVLRDAMHTLYAFVHDHDLGKLMLTTPAQALAAFRHRFMPTRILILADDAISALERESYHGGRVEVFYDQPLAGEILGLDVNSMYPAVMRDGEYPVWKLAKGTSLSLTRLRGMLARQCVIARVRIHTEAPAYPIVVESRLCFPVGDFWTVLTTPELRLALECGDLRECAEWVSYARRNLFREYVDELYDLRARYRAEGNTAFELMCKLMLNGLYGKFGQSGHVWSECGDGYDTDSRDFFVRCKGQTHPLLHHVRMGVVLHNERDAESQDSFPAIAAHVTADARVRLWRLREAAGAHAVYYCDTDSLYVNPDALTGLSGELHPTALGKLKLERRLSRAWFRASKDYDVDGDVKIKGIRKRAHKVADGEYVQEQFTSYDSMMSRDIEGRVDVKRVTKHVSHADSKSTATASGWREPLRLTVDAGAAPS